MCDGSMLRETLEITRFSMSRSLETLRRWYDVINKLLMVYINNLPHYETKSLVFCDQELVSGGTTSTVLRNLNANTVYKVTLLPMYENDVEGKRQSENGKTSESRCL